MEFGTVVLTKGYEQLCHDPGLDLGGLDITFKIAKLFVGWKAFVLGKMAAEP